MEILEEVVGEVPQEMQEKKAAKAPRVEWILGLIALLEVVLIVLMLAISLPKQQPEEDPEVLVHQSHQNEIPEETEAPAEETEPEETTEPTIPPEANPYGRLDFQYNRNNYLLCQKQDSYPGIDVSAFQGEIDWQQVADSGIQFASSGWATGATARQARWWRTSMQRGTFREPGMPAWQWAPTSSPRH